MRPKTITTRRVTEPASTMSRKVSKVTVFHCSKLISGLLPYPGLGAGSTQQTGVLGAGLSGSEPGRGPSFFGSLWCL